MNSRIPDRSRRTMTPALDRLESRQLLSTMLLPVHGAMPAHHHHELAPTARRRSSGATHGIMEGPTLWLSVRPAFTWLHSSPTRP
jgi:hypothetical protein